MRGAPAFAMGAACLLLGSVLIFGFLSLNLGLLFVFLSIIPFGLAASAPMFPRALPPRRDRPRDPGIRPR